MTKINVHANKKWAIGNPIYPKAFVNTGVNIHIRTVQNNINKKLNFTFPNALNKFIRGMEYDVINDDKQKI